MSSLIYRAWSEKAASNAIALAEESRLLLREKRFPRAYYLAHMSTEESAKSILLYVMSVSGTPESDIRRVTALLRDHKKKIEFLVSYAEGASEHLRTKLAEFRGALITHVNDLKNNTMYVSCTGASISTPEEKISDLDVESFVVLAEVLSRHAKGLPLVP